MFKSFLKGLGKGLATVGLYAAKGALYVSAHPEVVAAVAQIAVQAGAPQGAIAKGTQIAGYVGEAGQVIGAIEQAKSGAQQGQQ